MGPGRSGRAYSRVCGAATAFRPVAVGVGGAERGAPMSQGAYRRVCGAATPKGAAQRGCSATGPTPRATGFAVARRQNPYLSRLRQPNQRYHADCSPHPFEKQKSPLLPPVGNDGEYQRTDEIHPAVSGIRVFDESKLVSGIGGENEDRAHQRDDLFHNDFLQSDASSQRTSSSNT